MICLRISMVPVICELFLFLLGTYICLPETLWFMFIRSEFKSWDLEFLVTLKYFPQYLFKQNQSWTIWRLCLGMLRSARWCLKVSFHGLWRKEHLHLLDLSLLNSLNQSRKVRGIIVALFVWKKCETIIESWKILRHQEKGNVKWHFKLSAKKTPL